MWFCSYYGLLQIPLYRQIYSKTSDGEMFSICWNQTKYTYTQVEMNWKRRLFVGGGGGGYATIHKFALSVFFFCHSFRLPQVNFNSFWLCSCSTTHVNANETLRSGGGGDENKKKKKLTEYISWLQNIFNTHSFSVAQLRVYLQCGWLLLFFPSLLTARWALKEHIMWRQISSKA